MLTVTQQVTDFNPQFKSGKGYSNLSTAKKLMVALLLLLFPWINLKVGLIILRSMPQLPRK